MTQYSSTTSPLQDFPLSLSEGRGRAGIKASQMHGRGENPAAAHNRKRAFRRALRRGIVVFLAFWRVLSNKLMYHSLDVPFFWEHRGLLGSSGTRVKTAFLYLHRCDVRRQGPLHCLVTESQGKPPQLTPKP